MSVEENLQFMYNKKHLSVFCIKRLEDVYFMEGGTGLTENLDVRSAVKETLPTIFGYIGIGLAFGMVGKAAGFSTGVIFLMSAVIYAGSAQFVTVGMLASQSPVLSIIFSTFLINSRMILMGMALAPYFKKESMFRNMVTGTLLTDESFVLGMNKLQYTDHRLSFSWFHTVNFLSYATWVLSSAAGAVIGGFWGDPRSAGLDFAVTAMFIGLLYLQVMSDRSKAPCLQYLLVGMTLILTYTGMFFVPPGLLVLYVTLTGCGIGMVMRRVFF